jgi:diguanylate cyclase (GGDEF)-like protein
LSTERVRVLVVDDTEGERQTMARLIADMGYEVLEARDAAAALDTAAEEQRRGRRLHVVLLDLALPDEGPSFTIIPQLRRFHPLVEIVCITGHFEAERENLVEEAFRRYGAYDFLTKPSSPIHLRCTVRRAFRSYRVHADLAERNRELVELTKEMRGQVERLRGEGLDLSARLHRALAGGAEKERRFDRILRIGHSLLGLRDLNEIVRSACGEVLRAVPADGVVVFARKALEQHLDEGRILPGEDLCCLERHVGSGSSPRGGTALDEIEMALAADVAATGRTVVLPGRRGPASARLAQMVDGVRSTLCAPLACDGFGIVGAIQVVNRRGENGDPGEPGFSAEDEWTVHEIGRFLARAILAAYEAGRDPLTGLRNRREFELWRAGRPSPDRRRRATRGIALIDVDAFRSLNRDLGYLGADLVLQQLAAAIRHGLREGDRAWRPGGDEFVLELTGEPTKEEVEVVLERIRAAVRALPRPVTVSIGSTLLDASEPVEVGFERANGALRQAKESGGDLLAHSPSPG